MIRRVFVSMKSTILHCGWSRHSMQKKFQVDFFLLPSGTIHRWMKAHVYETGLLSWSLWFESLEVRLFQTLVFYPQIQFCYLGKPHPRWAESSFRDGDPNEKWHSRATKCVPLPNKRNGQQQQQQQTNQSQQPQLTDDMLRNGRAGLNPIKTEPTQEANTQLYRFSPSPAPSMRYHTFQADVRSDSSSSFDNDPRPGYNPTNGSGMYSTNATHYTTSGTGSTAPSTYSDGGGGGVTYPLSNSDDGNTSYGDHFSVNSSSPQSHFLCACRSNPALGITYLQLSQTVQQSLNSMRQYNHSTNSHCVLFRRVLELSNTLQYVLPYLPFLSFFYY